VDVKIENGQYPPHVYLALSTESIIAVIPVIVNLPTAILVLWKIQRMVREARRDSRVSRMLSLFLFH
jgi:hypothetical protein